MRLLTLQVQKIRKYFKELFKFLIILQDGSSLRQSEGQRRLKKIWREREKVSATASTQLREKLCAYEYFKDEKEIHFS